MLALLLCSSLKHQFLRLSFSKSRSQFPLDFSAPLQPLAGEVYCISLSMERFVLLNIADNVTWLFFFILQHITITVSSNESPNNPEFQQQSNSFYNLQLNQAFPLSSSSSLWLFECFWNYSICQHAGATFPDKPNTLCCLIYNKIWIILNV